MGKLFLCTEISVISIFTIFAKISQERKKKIQNRIAKLAGTGNIYNVPETDSKHFEYLHPFCNQSATIRNRFATPERRLHNQVFISDILEIKLQR